MMDFMQNHSSVSLDLMDISRDVSHNIWRKVDEGEGYLNFIVTISKTDISKKHQNNFLLGQAVLQQLREEYVIIIIKRCLLLI